jgi:beta-lactamase superfamily II metal-dependent hydrolase
MSLAIHDGLLQIFDMDYGSCALLTLPSPSGLKRVLIDCGHSSNYHGSKWFPGRHLEDQSVSYVDMLVCTNYDEDNVSGLSDLTRRAITIGCILGNPTVTPKAIGKVKAKGGKGDGIRKVAATLEARRLIGWAQTPPLIPGLNVTWTWNLYPYFDDENNLSLVVTLNIHGFNFMFPGDMNKKGFDHLLKTCVPFRQTVRGVHVLVAAHHGSFDGICPAMFDAYGCRPALVVISDDHKNHDTQKSIDYYGSKAAGIPSFRDQGARSVLSTRTDGEIRFSFKDGSYTAS